MAVALSADQIRQLREALWIVLLPASLVWAVMARFRRAFLLRPKYQAKVKVICVGNLHSGGSGKTPVVAAWLRRYGESVVGVLSRGYGGKVTTQGAFVDRHHPKGSLEYGDEPWLLSTVSNHPIYVGADRRKGARELEKIPGLQYLLMDDGFQNRGLKKDTSVICLSTHVDPAQSFCLPFGDLREPLSALRAASVALLTGGGAFEAQWLQLLEETSPKLPKFIAKSRLDGPFDMDGNRVTLTDTHRVGGFCGIAGAERFWLGLPVALLCKVEFADHHQYAESSLERLKRRASSMQLTHWITTEKDKVKLAHKSVGAELLWTRVEMEMPQAFWTFMELRL